MDSSLFQINQPSTSTVSALPTTKGAEAWIETTAPDCICVRNQGPGFGYGRARFEVLAGMKGYFHFAEGLLGVGVYTRHRPSDVIVGFDIDEFDAEGYAMSKPASTRPAWDSPSSAPTFPGGSSGELRQEAKVPLSRQDARPPDAPQAERDFPCSAKRSMARQPRRKT